MINCRSTKVYMDQCMIVTFSKNVLDLRCWWGGGGLAACRVQVLSSLSIHRENAKTLLMPSQLNFTTAMALCMGYCLELHLCLFFSANSFQNEVSGLCLVSLSAHIGLWSIWGFITEAWLIITLFHAVTQSVREQYNSNAKNTQKSPFTWEWAQLSKSDSSTMYYLTSQLVD